MEFDEQFLYESGKTLFNLYEVKNPFLKFNGYNSLSPTG